MDIPVQTILADNQNSANQKVEYVVLSRAELDALLAKRDAILLARHEDLLTQLAQQNAQLMQQNTLLTQQNTLLTQQNTLLTQQNAQLTQQNAQLTQQNALLTQQNTLLTQQNTLLTQQNAQQNAQFAELRALVGSLVKVSRYNQKRLDSIHGVVAGGKEPNSALLSDEVKRQQVLCGIQLYNPSKEYSKGTSFKKAARRVLNDSPLARKPGGYSPNQIDALARAIAREYKNPREIS